MNENRLNGQERRFYLVDKLELKTLESVRIDNKDIGVIILRKKPQGEVQKEERERYLKFKAEYKLQKLREKLRETLLTQIKKYNDQVKREGVPGKIKSEVIDEVELEKQVQSNLYDHLVDIPEEEYREEFLKRGIQQIKNVQKKREFEYQTEL